MVRDDHQGARPELGVHPARGVGEHHDPDAQLVEQEHGLHDEPRMVALVDVEAALEHHDGNTGEATQQEPAGVPGGRGCRPARELVEGDGDGVIEIVGEAPEPGAQDDPDIRDEPRPRAHRRDERGQPRGLLGGGDRG